GLATLVTLAALATADDQDKDKDKDKPDATKLEGTWVVESLERDGKPLTPDELKKLAKLTIKGNKYTWSEKTVPPGTFTVDTSKKPWAVDYTDSEGKNKDKTYLGILEMDEKGEKLKECYALPAGTKRPEKFEAPAKSPNTYIVWKREK